ncbi:MAG: LysE family translocator [Actinomycetota bacterium]|nr:LysE family translocator [Actinomycetota bacterium]
MVGSGRLAVFVATALVLIVIPGPSVLFVVSRALSLGRRAALATVVGNAAGEYLQVVAVALGLGAVVQRSVAVYTLVRLVGAGYLVFLGIQTVRHRRRLTTALDALVTPKSPSRVLAEGFVVGVTNPKSVVFFAAVLPEFVNRPGGHVAVQLLVLGLIFVAIALASDSTWAMVAGTARDRFVRSPRRLEMIGGAGGLAIVGLGLHLAVTGRKN